MLIFVGFKFSLSRRTCSKLRRKVVDLSSPLYRPLEILAVFLKTLILHDPRVFKSAINLENIGFIFLNFLTNQGGLATRSSEWNSLKSTFISNSFCAWARYVVLRPLNLTTLPNWYKRVDGLVDRPIYRKKGRNALIILRKNLCRYNFFVILWVKINMMIGEIPIPIIV